MATKTIDLEADAVEKLETAKWAPEECYSDVVRRAQFPRKPHLARELLCGDGAAPPSAAGDHDCLTGWQVMADDGLLFHSISTKREA